MNKAIKFLAYDERVSVICVDTKELVEKIRNLHDLTPTTTAAMGRFATISGIMGLTDIKESDDSITIQIKGEGPMGLLVSVVKQDGKVSKVKVYTQNPHVELPLKSNGKIDVGGAVGTTGFLNILKQNKVIDSEYNGVIPLVSGEIAEDFTEYFAKSEQKPTVLALGVLVNKEGVKASGGYMINLMPDATDDDITKIEEALNSAPTISEMLDKNMSLTDIAKAVTGDENVKVLEDDLSIVYECDCTKEKFTKGLISLGKDELTQILAEDKHADVVCHFCNKEYHFDRSDLETLIRDIESTEE